MPNAGHRLRYLGAGLAFVLSFAFGGCSSEPLVSEPASEGTGGRGPSLGLPCEVDALLGKYCRLCHGSGMRIGLMRLVTYDDLLAPAVTRPELTTGQLGLLRMTSPDLPMPPSGTRVSEPEIAEFRSWIEVGQPGTACAVAAPEE